MHQETTINSHEDVLMTTQEQQTASDICAKIAADYSQTESSMTSSCKTRLSSIYADQFRRILEEDERGLNTLNNRFANYLNKIKNLGDINIDLRHQIDGIHQKYIGHIEEEKQIDNKTSNSSKTEYNNIRQQLINESRMFTSFQIRLQRADYDKKYYKSKLKLFSSTDQIQLMEQQLNANLYELNVLKEQYQKEEKNLQSYKSQYDEYMAKLIEYINEYVNITSERIQSESCLCTIKEQLSFEREYNSQCKKEFEDLEKIECDLNNHFDKTELKKIIQQIRQDYQIYNEVQLSEVELSYKIKFDSIQKDFHHDKIENHSEEIEQLTEQNRSLQQKLEQLENYLHQITKQNRQQYKILNDEYHQLTSQLPEFESFIQHSRNNTVHLTSEINTYQCLLVNLVQKPKSKPVNFTVHYGNGIVWARI